MCGKTMMAVGFLRAGPLGEGVMEAMLRSFDFAQDDTSKAAIRGKHPPFYKIMTNI